LLLYVDDILIVEGMSLGLQHWRNSWASLLPWKIWGQQSKISGWELRATETPTSCTYLKRSILRKYFANSGWTMQKSWARLHWEAVKWILRYLWGSTNLKLCFCRSEPVLVAYTNVNLARDVDSRKSILSCMHQPVQPKSLSWWGKVGNSLILQHFPSRAGSPRPHTSNIGVGCNYFN
jgi:hypothetical protein